MSPRIFDRYMVQLGLGRNRKLVTLTDSEFRAHVAGVLAIAAQADPRGYLLVGADEATAAEIANEAGGKVTARVAASAVAKLKDKGVLEWDADAGAWYVHDWDEINPEPRPDPTAAERQRRHRANVTRESRGNCRDSHADVTQNVTPSPSPPTPPSPPREGEGEAGSARKRATTRIDQSKRPENFPDELVAAGTAVLPILRRIWDVRGGVQPQPRGVGLAILRNPRADHQRVALKLEHYLTAGKGVRVRCADVTARFGDWVADEEAAERPSDANVVRGRFAAYDEAAGL